MAKNIFDARIPFVRRPWNFDDNFRLNVCKVLLGFCKINDLATRMICIFCDITTTEMLFGKLDLPDVNNAHESMIKFGMRYKISE